jgi:hypothetical protein
MNWVVTRDRTINTKEASCPTTFIRYTLTNLGEEFHLSYVERRTGSRHTQPYDSSQCSKSVALTRIRNNKEQIHIKGIWIKAANFWNLRRCSLIAVCGRFRESCCLQHYWGLIFPNLIWCRSWWPRSLRRGPTAARFLELRVRIPRGGMDVTLVDVVCCQVEVSASGRSLVQDSPTECGVSEYDLEPSADRVRLFSYRLKKM